MLEKISLGNLEIDYKIDLTFFSDLSLEEAFISYLKFADKSSKLDADLTLTGTFGGKLELSASLMTKVKTTVEIEFDAANAEVRFDLIFYGKLKIEGNISLSTLKKEGQIKAEGQFGFKLVLIATATGKLQKYFISADIDFEAKAEANGYFSAGLSLGLDDFKGCYFKPTISHSGIKIAYSFYIKINGYKRIKSDEKVIIKGDKANMDQKYYINK